MKCFEFHFRTCDKLQLVVPLELQNKHLFYEAVLHKEREECSILLSVAHGSSCSFSRALESPGVLGKQK